MQSINSFLLTMLRGYLQGFDSWVRDYWNEVHRRRFT